MGKEKLIKAWLATQPMPFDKNSQILQSKKMRIDKSGPKAK